MIEVKKNDEKGTKELWNNEEIIDKSDFRIYGDDDYWVLLKNTDSSEMIMKNSFDLISKDIKRLEIYYPLEFWNMVEKIMIMRDYKKSNSMSFIFYIEFDFEEWKNQYSITEFAQVMEQVVSSYNSLGIEWEQEDEVISNGCYIKCKKFDYSSTINEVFTQYVEHLKEIHDKASILLYSKSNNSVISVFDFPEEVRIPCEQYLVYFAQFLKEIGIETVTSIQNESGKILFSVTPTTPEIALEQIRNALSIYLKLPVTLKDAQYNPMVMEPNVQQLLANIQHLQGQLMLARAITQASEITIQNQQNIITQQQKMIDLTILQHSYIKSEEENEKFLGGTLTIKEYEGNGFAINVPEIYRRIKELIINKNK
ncbi:hypothetical protein PPSQR21_035660 [Paenibacillus polymyxa SQR-21]|uniref:hypothetical protein n=2 Tax=Paenibacillus polymyxa TaxID=1406 RepID=UPI00042EEE73|nr:hypothetical protein [Paenibacillus polymyxa]AHM67204.1 hypothetical protein PPSQR21_035660 [Paenibacillus polymyxa SQR-21]